MAIEVDIPVLVSAAVGLTVLSSFFTKKFVSRKAAEEMTAAAEKQHEVQVRIKELTTELTSTRKELEKVQEASCGFTKLHHDCELARHKATAAFEQKFLEKLSEVLLTQERFASDFEHHREVLTVQLQAMQNTIEGNLRKELSHVSDRPKNPRS